MPAVELGREEDFEVAGSADDRRVSVLSRLTRGALGRTKRRRRNQKQIEPQPDAPEEMDASEVSTVAAPAGDPVEDDTKPAPAAYYYTESDEFPDLEPGSIESGQAGDETDAVPAPAGYYYTESDEFPELEPTDSSTEEPSVEPLQDSTPGEFFESDEVEVAVTDTSDEAFPAAEDTLAETEALEEVASEEPGPAHTSKENGQTGEERVDGVQTTSAGSSPPAGSDESPYWQPRTFWLTVSGAFGQAEQGNLDPFRQRLLDEGFSEWEVDRHIEVFEQNGANAYTLAPISRESPISIFVRRDGELRKVDVDAFAESLGEAKYDSGEIREHLEVMQSEGVDGYMTHTIAITPPKVQREAAARLEDYKVEGGYDLVAALMDDVPESVFTDAGFPSVDIDSLKTRANALLSLEPYRTTEGGYDLVAAIEAGVDEDTILQAGFTPSHYNAASTGAPDIASANQTVSADQVEAFRDLLNRSGFSEDEIDSRVKLLQSLGPVEYARQMKELDDLGLNTSVTQTSEADMDDFWTRLRAHGLSEDDIEVRVKLLESLGPEEYTRQMKELDDLGLSTSVAEMSTADIDDFRTRLRAHGLSEDDIEVRVKLLQSLGPVEYTRQMKELNELGLDSAVGPKLYDLEGFRQELMDHGYTEPEIEERLRVWHAVGQDKSKYLETTMAGIPPQQVLQEADRISDAIAESLANELVQELNPLRQEMLSLSEKYGDPYQEAQEELKERGELDNRFIERIREERWLEGQRQGFPNLVAPVVEKWQHNIDGEEWTGTMEEFEQFYEEHEQALEGSWPGTIPEVVEYLEKKLKDAELVAPEQIPAIQAALEHAEMVNVSEPQFGRTDAETAMIAATFALPLKAPLFLIKGFAKFGIRPTGKMLEKMIGAEGWRELGRAWNLTHDPITGRAIAPFPLGNLSAKAKTVIADALGWPVASVEERLVQLGVAGRNISANAYRRAERLTYTARQWEAKNNFDDAASVAFGRFQRELQSDVTAGRITQAMANRHTADAAVMLGEMRDFAVAAAKSPDWPSIKNSLDLGRFVAGGSGSPAYPLITPRVPIPGTTPRNPGVPGTPILPFVPGTTPDIRPGTDPYLDPSLEPTPGSDPSPGFEFEPLPEWGRVTRDEPTPARSRTLRLEPTIITPEIEPNIAPRVEPTVEPHWIPAEEPSREPRLPPTTPIHEPITVPVRRIGRVETPADEPNIKAEPDPNPDPFPDLVHILSAPPPPDIPPPRRPDPTRVTRPPLPPSKAPPEKVQPGGVFPKVVEVVAGFNRKVIDLDTGAVENYLMPREQYTNPLGVCPINNILNDMRN